MRVLVPVTLSGLIASPALAAEMAVTVEIPQLSVAEYHRPYVALWVERPDQSVAANLAVWYDVKMRDNEGTKWLKDMRQWWRRIGRDLTMPVDGVSGPTRAPGEHRVTFVPGKGGVPALEPGSYVLVVEAAREVGGRELLRIPFEWPAAKPAQATAKGEAELGRIALDVTP